MNVRNQLLALQWSQLKHDEAYHKDVVILPLAERIKHMALHNAKYTGHFVEAIDTGDEDNLVQRLTDAFIITLASANTLNQDLGLEFGAIGEADSLREAGEQLAGVLSRDASDPLWIVRQFAKHNGQLANICESWDHLEAMPFREGMKACNLALHQAVLADCAGRSIEINDAYLSRIRVIETRSIFDKLFREDAGGAA